MIVLKKVILVVNFWLQSAPILSKRLSLFQFYISLLIVVFPTRTDNPRRPRNEYPNLPVFIHTVENANL